MPDREVNLSELHESIIGKKLLNFATDVEVSIRVEEEGGQLTAKFGGPNKLYTIKDKERSEPAGTGKDLESALTNLFNAVKSAPMVKSEAQQKGKVTFVGRCQFDGHFTARAPRY